MHRCLRLAQKGLLLLDCDLQGKEQRVSGDQTWFAGKSAWAHVFPSLNLPLVRGFPSQSNFDYNNDIQLYPLSYLSVIYDLGVVQLYYTILEEFLPKSKIKLLNIG